MRQPLVLHICCAPDEAYVIHLLNHHYALHCFFCNPNIAPADEYHKRLAEARRIAIHYQVPFDADPYLPESWQAAVAGLTHTAEGAARCQACFMLRLRATAHFCATIGQPRFTTVMSVSPHKRIALLNECGALAATEYGVAYEPFDFKKNDGFKKSIQLSQELAIYRQDYCGCTLSLHERELRKKNRAAVD